SPPRASKPGPIPPWRAARTTVPSGTRGCPSAGSSRGPKGRKRRRKQPSTAGRRQSPTIPATTRHATPSRTSTRAPWTRCPTRRHTPRWSSPKRS
ncbi:MAG: hypothetical protein AVDCRST_MAG25-3231, partial [uncultured Rubrobacteraceae bacterium]